MHSWIVLWFAPHPWEANAIFENGNLVRYQNEVRMWLHTAGFNTRPLRGQWFKQSGQTQQPDISLSNDHECFYYAMKGSPKLHKPGRLATYHYPPIKSRDKTNAAERPIGMYKDLLYTFVREGSTICSPCVGSGSVILAASNIACNCFGWDNEKANKNEYIVKVNSAKAGEYESEL